MKNTLLTRGVEEVIVRNHLEKNLNSGKKLRVKLGIDPTAKDLHLGHSVVLRKLGQFQDAGHKAVLIIGDFTATIGDPSGRNELRPVLTEGQIKQNMKDYLKQAGKILDLKKTEVRYNSEWLKPKGFDFLIDLTSKFTIARITERDDFRKRIKEGRDVSMLELIYPLLQGYDSIAVKADVELGGTDQKFNLLMGRKVQKRFGEEQQDIVTVPLIEGIDGVHKMSKSLGNYIGISERPGEMYAKIMSIPDDLMAKYFILLTDISEKELKQLRLDMDQPGLASRSPKEWKQRLAHKIVEMYHSKNAAQAAAESFESKFGKSKSQTKADFTLKKKPGDYPIIDILVEGGLASSKSEARRKIKEGAVEVDAVKIKDELTVIKLTKNSLIRLGRRFLRIK